MKKRLEILLKLNDIPSMAMLAELQHQADLLSKPDKNALISHLVRALKGWPLDSVSEEELNERDRAMDADEVELVSHSDFKTIVLSDG